jgi:hypothetical protein
MAIFAAKRMHGFAGRFYDCKKQTTKNRNVTQ